MDSHQNVEYGSSSEFRSGSYPDLSMDENQNPEYDFSSKSKVWIYTQI